MIAASIKRPLAVLLACLLLGCASSKSSLEAALNRVPLDSLDPPERRTGHPEVDRLSEVDRRIEALEARLRVIRELETTYACVAEAEGSIDAALSTCNQLRDEMVRSMKAHDSSSFNQVYVQLSNTYESARAEFAELPRRCAESEAAAGSARRGVNNVPPLVIAFSSLAVAGLVAGTTAGVVAIATKSELDASCEEVSNVVRCSPGMEPLRDSVRSAALVSDMSLAMGVTFALADGVLLLTGAPSTKRSSPSRTPGKVTIELGPLVRGTIHF